MKQYSEQQCADPLLEKGKNKAERERLTQKRIQIEQENEDFIQEVLNFLELAKKAPELYKAAEPDLKRELIQTVFLELKIRGKELIYRFKPEFQILCDRKVYDGGR